MRVLPESSVIRLRRTISSTVLKADEILAELVKKSTIPPPKKP